MPQNPSSDHNAERSGAAPTPPSEHSTPSKPSTSAAAQSSSQKAVPGWQTVEFPNVINEDVSQRQEHYKQAMEKKAAPSIRITSGGAKPGQAAMPPSFSTAKKQSAEGLIKLIQAANQRNHELQNRIADLEEALEESRQALQSELDRPEEPPSDAPQATSHDASQQVNYLLNQLEFVQQSNQRQEILAETLSNQLQESQKRVAELESECQRLQHIITAQTTQLQQHEAQCSDLKARLVRQQQYTLQFKSALEKCLEVPPPSYETAADYSTVGYNQPFENPPDRPETADSPSIEMPSTSDSPVSETVLPQASVPLSIPQDRPEDAESLGSAPDTADTADAPDINGASDDRPDPAKLVEAFFPKVDQIKPWSAQKSDGLVVESVSVDQPRHAEPAAPEKSASPIHPDGAGVFLSKFHNTLRELANTDLTQPVEGEPQPPSSASESKGAIAAASTPDASTIEMPIEADSQTISAMDIDQPANPGEGTNAGQSVNAGLETAAPSEPLGSQQFDIRVPALNRSSDGPSNSPSAPLPDETESSNKTEAQGGTKSVPTAEISPQPDKDTSPSQEMKVPPSPWRSLMPPKLQLGKADASAGTPSSDSADILLPGEARQPSNANADASPEGGDREYASSNRPTRAADTGETAEETFRQQTQEDPVWHDLAHLVHATTDDIIRANEARTFSVFAPTLQDTVPSLLEIFSPPEVSGPSTVEAGAVPLNLSIPDQEATQPDHPIPDPWARAPGSYLNTAQPSEKSAGIAPLSFQNAETAKPVRGLSDASKPTPIIHEAHATSPEDRQALSGMPEATNAPPRRTPHSTPQNIPQNIPPTMPPGTSHQGAVPAIPPIHSAAASDTDPSDQSDPVDAIPLPKRPSLSTILLARSGVSVPPSSGSTRDDAASPSRSVDGSEGESAQEQIPSIHPAAHSRNPNWPSPLLYPVSRDKADPKNDDVKPAKSGIDLPAFLR